jgi:hypothetical protein
VERSSGVVGTGRACFTDATRKEYFCDRSTTLCQYACDAIEGAADVLGPAEMSNAVTASKTLENSSFPFLEVGFEKYEFCSLFLN